MSHTPGPWYWFHGNDAGLSHVPFGANGKPEMTKEVSVARFNSYIDSLKIKDADARLIAAAPDLLEALKGCLSLQDNVNGWVEFHTDSDEYAKAKAAIKKAEGRG
jgi:hypothetical protein